MNEYQIRRIIQEEMEKNYRSGSPMIPPHQHNGNDNFRINEKDIVKNNKFMFIAEITDGPFTLDFVPNPSSLLFYGFAANNAGGGAASKKAVVNGNVQFGNCRTVLSLTSPGSNPSTNFIQVSNSMYIDESDVANTAVTASREGFVYVQDHTGSIVALASVTSINQNTISGTATLASGWQITGAFLVI